MPGCILLGCDHSLLQLVLGLDCLWLEYLPVFYFDLEGVHDLIEMCQIIDLLLLADELLLDCSKIVDLLDIVFDLIARTLETIAFLKEPFLGLESSLVGKIWKKIADSF